MINHSCDSNYGRVWDLNKNIVKAFATRGIKKGEEITDGYSGVFLNVPQDDREIIHARYHFACACIACKQNWPLKNALPNKIPNSKDKNVNKLKSLLKQKDNLKLSNSEKLNVLRETLDLAYIVLKRPHLIICNVENEFYNQLRLMH